MKDESGLRSKFMEVLKARLPNFVALRHEDVRTCGIPDLSLTGFGRTTWWEFKHGTPDFESNGLQELTMNRLAVTGYARYVLWQENADGTSKRTLIVQPRHLGGPLAEVWCVGYDHQFIVEYMRKVHQP